MKTNSAGNPYKKTYYYYSKENFISYAIESYKYDKTIQAKRDKILPSDCTRFYSILCRDVNRDDFSKLVQAKAFVRSDLDGALSYADQIMQKVAIQFNDPNLIFTMTQTSFSQCPKGLYS